MIMEPVVNAPSAPSRAGRPRSEGCRRRILAAADSLLTRDGFAGTSVDDIAAAAGVSKATIYRWWPNKAAVVMEALLEAIEADFKAAADGDAEEDLIARIRRTIALFRSPKGRMLASLIGEAQFDSELAKAYRQRLLRPRRAGLQAALARAVAAGALRLGVDLELATDIVYGPLYARLLLGHAPLDDAFERNYPAIALAALRGCTAASATG
jgi:AcrR family transcriptional regulator